jgi:hypothetical protein
MLGSEPEHSMKTSRSLPAALLLVVCSLPISAGDKLERRAYEPGCLIKAEQERHERPRLIIQTECCDYTIENWHLFGGLTIGACNDVRLVNTRLFVRVGKKEAGARILSMEQRLGFAASLVMVMDTKGNRYRAAEGLQLPDGWRVVTRDAEYNFHLVVPGTAVPEGWSLVRGMPGEPLPAVWRSK